MRYSLSLLLLITVSALIAQTGGPDEFGYTWANSNAASGPTYDWIDFTNSTTCTGVTDDWVSGQIPLGFDFPFYGETYDYIYICSNGVVGFNTDNITTYENTSIPNADAPNNMICWFWDDLNPTHTWAVNESYQYEQITYNGMNAFLVSAFNMPEYNTSGSHPNNCMQGQVLLIEDGSVLVQYDWFGASFDKTHACVGLENIDGTIALQYCYGDPSLLTDDLAIMFYPPGPAFDNDLAVTGFKGNGYPSLEHEETYTIYISNVGVLDQTTYTVMLFDEDGMEIEEVDGLPVESNETVAVELDWTPMQLRDMTVHAHVLLPTDENEENDVSDTYPIDVQTSDVDVEQLGYGVDELRAPLDFYYRASLSETIYFADEINVDAGYLTMLAWRADFYEPCWDMPVRIWVGETTQTDLEDGWIASGDLTLVFDGELDFPDEAGDVLAPFSTFYDYQGDNLVVMVEHVQTDEIYSQENMFHCTDTATAHPSRMRTWQSDVYPAAPSSPEGGQIGDSHPNTAFFFTTGEIEVTVYPWTPEGEVLPTTVVTLVGDETYSTTCDDGFALLEDIAPGDYQLQISQTGFFDHTELVRVPSSRTFEATLNDTIRPPQNVFCSEWALLSWEAPWDYAREIIGYKIYLNEQYHDTCDSLSYRYAGLENDTDYTAGVSAVFSYGESEVISYGFHYLPTNDNTAPACVTALVGASPNPFNPSTTVRFSLAQPGEVTLCAYDVRGRKVATIMSGWMEDGDHAVVWEPTDCASGVYLLRLSANGREMTTRALLLK